MKRGGGNDARTPAFGRGAGGAVPPCAPHPVVYLPPVLGTSLFSIAPVSLCLCCVLVGRSVGAKNVLSSYAKHLLPARVFPLAFFRSFVPFTSLGGAGLACVLLRLCVYGALVFGGVCTHHAP